MNKSKFLKKSLAMLLAVMLVVAMIPLGASAAWSNDNAVVTVKPVVGGGTLEATETDRAYAWTLPYYTETTDNGKVQVELHRLSGYDDLDYVLVDEDGNPETLRDAIKLSTNTKTTIWEIASIPAGYKQVILEVKDSTGEKETQVYTVDLSIAEPSTDPYVVKATLGVTKPIEGAVDNAKKTITFTVPWGYATPSSGDNGDVNVYLKYPVKNKDPQEYEDQVAAIGTDTYIQIEAQHGNFTKYTVITKEAVSLTSLTVAGAVAKLDTDVATMDHYNVVVPEDTDLTKKQVVTFKTAKAATAKWVADPDNTAVTENPFTSGKEVTVAAKNEITFTDSEGNAKTYTVNVTKYAGNDASITAFTASAVVNSTDEYVEIGKIEGDKLTVELPKESDLTEVVPKFTVAAGATVVVNDNASFANDGDRSTAANKIDLSNGKTATVRVEAADGKTYKYYELSATNAKSVYGDPKITAAKMKIGDKEYTATISDSSRTITFTVPYATATGDIPTPWTDSAYTFAKSFATRLYLTDGHPTKPDDTNPFSNPNEIAVISDSNDWVTYKVVFNKEAAKTGKEVSNLTVSEGTTPKTVTEENTYKINLSGAKATVTLPYSYDPDGGKKTVPALVPQFEISEGAALHMGNAAVVSTSPMKSGFNEDTEAVLTEIASGAFPTVKTIVVADETAALLLKEEATKTPTPATTISVTDLQRKAEYRGHVKIYTLEIKYAKAELGHTLFTFTGEIENKGAITSKVGTTTLEITVPYSTTFFSAEYTASKLAQVVANNEHSQTLKPTAIPLPKTPVKADAAENVTGCFKVNKAGATPVLEVYNGTAYEPVEDITVVNEAGTDSTRYDVVLKVAPAKKDADFTSFKVNGVKGAIDTAKKTVLVNLPFNTDLTGVTMEYEVSELATVTIDGTNPVPTVGTNADGDNLYDLSKPIKLQVTAEDVRVNKVYTITVTAATQFTDVKEGQWYYKNVMTAASEGIIKGIDNGDGTYSFNPNGNVTRQDFAVMLVGMLGVDVSGYTTNPFDDEVSKYAVGAVAYCAENGFISGSKVNNKAVFEGSRSITRQEAASIMKRTLNLVGNNTSKFNDDAKIDNWAKSAVYACKVAGVIVGDDLGNFNPKKTLTRAEAATIMVNSKNK